jgi:predicted ribosome quality control (RQC) complex YloA/Tae2 family protein
MKTNAITSTNFKGLFTNNSIGNGGNWRMEYRPYSWETKMSPKVQIDVFSHTLPDNEELFVQEYQRELSKDILGTVSYLKDTSEGRDTLRRTITEMNSMNLEDSLKIQDRKFAAFLNMKQEAMHELKSNLQSRMDGLFDIAQEHHKYADDIDRGWAAHVYDKETRAYGVSKYFDKMTKLAEDNGNYFKKYIELSESAEAISRAKEAGREELSRIESAKRLNAYIDISRRDIEKPNEPLIKALANLAAAKEKRVALSHRTILVQDIIKGVGKDFSIKKAIEYVEMLMKKRL